MIYIENEGAIYRGFSRGWPTEVWSRRERRFAPYSGAVPKDVDWGNEIGEAEAREIMGVPAGDTDAPAVTFLEVYAKHIILLRVAPDSAPTFFNRKTHRWHPWPGPIPPCARPIGKPDAWRAVRHDMLGLDFGTLDRPERQWPAPPSATGD